MPNEHPPTAVPADAMTDLLRTQAEAASQFFEQILPGSARALPEPADLQQWGKVAERLQAMWLEFQSEPAISAAHAPLQDPTRWLEAIGTWYQRMPLANPDVQARLWEDGLKLWEGVLGQYGIGPAAATGRQEGIELPRRDRRFADPRWREQPFFALVHQTYLMLAEQVTAMAENLDGLDPVRQEQLRFITKAIVDALSPANLPFTNPLVIDKAIETRGESLVAGLEHLLGDVKRGQLTHTQAGAFKLGENIAMTPGKVVYQSRLFQLIQYSPTTETVLATPLVIFPPWINRFYILDLNPQKSFVRWAVEQGLTVFMVSWKSADASMADVTWDDYVAAQIEAIDVVRERLAVPAAHVIGYCVAGTTLAATLAVLARRGEAGKVKSATFFTAQVDFEKAGELKIFVDDPQLAMLEQLGAEGVVDGRYLAATFNLLLGNDLIWNYVVNNYLLGQDYPAFDLLFWNGDTTNLPAKWHQAYLRELYRDNRLVVPDSLSVCGTPIDLGLIETPCYIQAGREDHIAPAESVWRLTRHLSGPWTFLLAGSGHIAGVVNPPAANKYQYWTNSEPGDSLESFIAGAGEHPGSWWPHWLQWLSEQDPARVPAKGKRKPGGKGDPVIEDAPGSFVKAR